MKKIISKILLAVILLGISPNIFSQTFECRVIEDDYGYLVYQMRETSGTNTPTTSTDIWDITFTIRYPSGSVDLALLCTTNDYSIIDGLAGEQTDGTYDYHYWNADIGGSAIHPPHDWVQNQWEDICKFKTSGATGSGLFEVAPDGWHSTSLDWTQTVSGYATSFTPTIIPPGITYTYATTVYTFVWKGGLVSHGHDYSKIWEYGANWQNECGTDRSGDDYPYQATDNIIIPDVSGASNAYPEATGNWNDGWNCNNLNIMSNAHITVPDLSGNSPTHLTVAEKLTVNGKLYLPALGYATVSGSTEIDNAEGIEVQASSSGVGSFIDDGTITYGTGGTGKAQTYLTNSAGAGSFYMHLVGPTLDDENYTGTGTGAFLGAFNVANGNTYAYSYDQGTGDWDNINSTTYEVHTADGIGLSTTDAAAYTMNMSGEFITGNVTHSVGFGGTDDELISNPYPSAIDADAFATDGSNSGVIANKNWLWDPSSGNYLARSGGSGGQQYIQVGQAFFVETTSAGSVTFKNSFRTHSDAAFRDVNPNELTMKVSGGDYGFKDELVVRFVEDATFGYDPAIDAYKMNSMYDDATQIESIAEDGSELSINFLPVDGLSGDMVSVPVHFQCGYSGEFTFDFKGIETFENQNEIWLEDKKDNDSWIYLNNNPHYTFTAVTYEPHDRFILHFFGPTGIDENSVDNPVDIYSYRQYVYIKKNEPNEVIKKVSVYNINGEDLFSKRVPDQPVNKLWVSEQVGYYLVRVITDKNSYTGKVFIFK